MTWIISECKSLRLFLYVGQSQVQNPANMVVVKPVIKDRAVAAVGHQVQLPQHPQLVTGCRFAYLEKGGQIADAHLARLQGVEDLQPGGVAHGLEELGHVMRVMFR